MTTSLKSNPDFTRPLGAVAPELGRPTSPINPRPLNPRLRAILDEDAERERHVLAEALGGGTLVTTEDSPTVARVVDMLTDDPARFVVRFLNLERYVMQLTERVEGLSAREVI